MFRYKKADAATPASSAVPSATAPAATIDVVEAIPNPSMRRPSPTAPAKSVSADKDKKRKERLGEIKLELHRELLDNLNLAALEHASEQDLRSEINSIAAEVLQEKGIVLNREDRTSLSQDLFDEVTGLGPLETLLKDDDVNDILVNGPQQVFIEKHGYLF